VRDPHTEHDYRRADNAGDQDDPVNELADEPAGESEDTEAGSMEEELEAERQRSAEYLDQAQRARAELVNYRRRTEDELARMQKHAGERVITRFLPAIDDLDRAIELMSEEDRATPWGEGILLVQRKIWSTLESEGVAPIESLGKPFDPSLHEAISMQDGANGATTVVQEYQRGFTLGERVLRPAMVVVGAADESPSESAGADTENENEDSNDQTS
jgi:molecular chaperone GrpE